MSVTLVQTTNANQENASGFTVAFGSNVTSGNVLMMFFHFEGSTSASVTSVTDNLGNTWSKLIASTVGGYNYQDTEVWTVASAISGATTLTIDYSGTNYSDRVGVSISEWSGLASAAVDGAPTTSSGTGTSYTGTTATPTQTGDLAIVLGAFAKMSGVATASPGSPWTDEPGPIIDSTASAQDSPWAWQVLTGTTAVSATWTSWSTSYGTVNMLFKAAAPTPGLGFAGAGGVGRPFTFQDLFNAVQPTLSPSASTVVTVLNQFVDSYDESIVTESLTLALAAPSTYDSGMTWEAGIWQ